MAARRAVPERTRRPARPGPQAAADFRARSARSSATIQRAASEIARYLGNAYLETVARAAAGSGGRERSRARVRRDAQRGRRARPALDVAGDGCRPSSPSAPPATPSSARLTGSPMS